MPVSEEAPPELAAVHVRAASSPQGWVFTDVVSGERLLDVVRCVLTVDAQEWPQVELERHRLDAAGQVVIEETDRVPGRFRIVTYVEVRCAVFDDMWTPGEVA